MTPLQEQLVLDNLPLVRWVVNKWYGLCPDREDLIQVGTLGLMKAARYYDPAQGTVFGTYATECIRNTLRSYLAKAIPETENLSLDEPLGESDGETHADLLPDEQPSPEETTVAGCHVKSLLATLSEREAQVLRLRYGLETGEPMTGDEVGAVLGLSKMRVSQIERQALSRLRKTAQK